MSALENGQAHRFGSREAENTVSQKESKGQTKHNSLRPCIEDSPSLFCVTSFRTHQAICPHSKCWARLRKIGLLGNARAARDRIVGSVDPRFDRARGVGRQLG